MWYAIIVRGRGRLPAEAPERAARPCGALEELKRQAACCWPVRSPPSTPMTRYGWFHRQPDRRGFPVSRRSQGLG